MKRFVSRRDKFVNFIVYLPFSELKYACPKFSAVSPVSIDVLRLYLERKVISCIEAWKRVLLLYVKTCYPLEYQISRLDVLSCRILCAETVI